MAQKTYYNWNDVPALIDLKEARAHLEISEGTVRTHII